MWVRNEDRNGQEILDEVEIDGILWVEIPDEKGGQPVCSKAKDDDPGCCLSALS